MKILYIHGYNGSPAGEKTTMLRQRFNQAKIIAPQHESRPDQVFSCLKRYAETMSESDDLLVGSSLGGFWANLLAVKFSLPAVMINPAVRPSESLAQLGCAFAEDYAAYEAMTSPQCSAARRVLLAEDDEVLPYRIAWDYFNGFCPVEVFPTGGHRMNDPASLDRIAAAVDALLCPPLVWIDEECLVPPVDH